MNERNDQIVRHEHVNIQQPSDLKVCLNRGQKGTYGWEIQYSGQDKEKILETIGKVDEGLRANYTVEEQQSP